MTDDAQLLSRYVHERREDGFAALVQRHLPLVYHAALRQLAGDARGAEDVAQVVFTDLARKAPALLRHPLLAGWLHAGTRRAVAQHRRAAARRTARHRAAHAMTAPLEPEAAPAAGETTPWAELRPVIDDALAALSARDREAVLLRFFEERPFAEVGAQLGLREDAARMRVERALEKLRRQLWISQRAPACQLARNVRQLLGQKQATIRGQTGFNGFRERVRAGLPASGNVKHGGCLP